MRSAGQRRIEPDRVLLSVSSDNQDDSYTRHSRDVADAHCFGCQFKMTVTGDGVA